MSGRFRWVRRAALCAFGLALVAPSACRDDPGADAPSAELTPEEAERLRAILARGRLADREEYEFAVDIIVIAQQQRHLSAEEADRLSGLIGAFELRAE